MRMLIGSLVLFLVGCVYTPIKFPELKNVAPSKEQSNDITVKAVMAPSKATTHRACEVEFRIPKPIVKNTRLVIGDEHFDSDNTNFNGKVLYIEYLASRNLIKKIRECDGKILKLK